MQLTVKCTRYALLIIILFIYDMNTLIYIIENEKHQNVSLKQSPFPFSVVDLGVVEGVSSPLIAKKIIRFAQHYISSIIWNFAACQKSGIRPRLPGRYVFILGSIDSFILFVFVRYPE